MRLGYGEKAKDKVTGFEGIVTGYIDHYGMRPGQYILESLMKEGYTFTHTVDENRIIPANDVKTSNKVFMCEG